jgi:hypothetical protein
MRSESFIIFTVILFVSIIFFEGCYKKEIIQEPYEDWESQPYTDYENVTKTRKIPFDSTYYVDKLLLAEPYFPVVKNKVIKIAVLPFTDSSPQQTGAWGTEIAEEIEYELIKRVEKWDDKSIIELKNSMYKYTDPSKYDGISSKDIDTWFEKNKRPNYEVVNRTELQMILKEADITSENYINKIRKNITAIDGLIIGHVKDLSDYNTSFIAKCVDVNTSKIIFNQRYEGNYTSCINDFVDAFFYNIQYTNEKTKRNTTAYKTETYSERDRVTKYRDVRVTKYKEKEVEVFDHTQFWVGTILLGIAVYVAIENQPEDKK